MTAKIIDGKGIAADLRGKVADAVHRLARDRGIVPGLAVVLVGNNPASESYVASKMKMTVGSGMRSFDHRLPKETSEAELLGLIARLNADPSVHGILVQLPLPAQIDPHKIIAAVDPAKDVDGFSPVNAGRLCAGLPALAPCTPVGCILLAKTVQPSLAGGGPRIGGDVAFAEVAEVAGAISPVPGGVGPMAIACLLANTVRAACALAGLREPAFGQPPAEDRE